MGKIFGDLSYAPTRTLYSGAPIEEVKALAQSADKSYKTNQDAFDALDVAAQNAATLAKDDPIKQARVQALKDQLKAASEGRMELAASQARKAAKDYATDQLFNAAQQDYQSNAAYIKDINDRKDLSTLDKEAAIALTQYHNQNTLEKDPKTGIIKNRFSGYTAPEKSVDIAKAQRAFLEGAKDNAGIIKDKNGNPMLRDVGNGQYIGMGDWKGISSAEATKMAHEYANQSPEIQSYLQFKNDAHNLGKFTQKDPTTGKLIEKPVDTNDLQDLGYEIQNGIAGISVKDKSGKSVFKPLPIYDSNGNLDINKAKQVYNKTWQQKELEKSTRPASDWLAHYEEDLKTMANRDYTDAKDKPQVDEVSYNATQLEPVTTNSLADAGKNLSLITTDIKKAQNEVAQLTTAGNTDPRVLATAKNKLAELQRQQSDIQSKVNIVRKDRDSRPEFNTTEDLVESLRDAIRFRNDAPGTFPYEAKQLAETMYNKLPANVLTTKSRLTLQKIVNQETGISGTEFKELYKDINNNPTALSFFKQNSIGLESAHLSNDAPINSIKNKNEAYFKEHGELQVGSTAAVGGEYTNIQNRYTTLLKAGTNFKTLLGDQLTDYTGNTDIFNGDNLPDITKSHVYPTTQPDNQGNFLLQFVAANSKGEDIYIGDNDIKNRAQKLIYPQNQEQLANDIYTAAAKEYQKAKTGTDAEAALQTMGNVTFRNAYKADPSDMKTNESRTVNLLGSEFTFTKVGDNAFTVTKDGTKVSVPNPKNPDTRITTFANTPEFVLGLQIDKMKRENGK